MSEQAVPTKAPKQTPAVAPEQDKTAQRKSARGEARRQPQASNGGGLTPPRRGLLQRAATDPSPLVSVPPLVRTAVQSPGRPLDSAARTLMEPHFNYDFSQVRIHTDALAAESARAVRARAYTLGRDLVFGAGQYSPSSPHGRRLLAHELAHVVQQAGGYTGALLQPAAGQTSTLEAEADSAAAALDRGLPYAVTQFAFAGLSRKTLDVDVIYAKNDPVGLIRLDVSTHKVTFYTASGSTYTGTVNTDLDPGTYTLVPQIRVQRWVITETVKPGLRFDVTLDNANPWNLPYNEKVRLEVTASASDSSPLDLTADERIAEITKLVQNKWTDNADELSIIRLLKETPLAQAQEMLKKISEQKIDGKAFLDALDDVVDGENNLKLHEALSALRIKAQGVEKGTEAMMNAPVLPWHDVMGFFEDAATFSVKTNEKGKIVIEYHAGTQIMSSKDFGSEMKKLPFNIFVGGQEYDPDQVLVIHDYDQGRYVTVTASELAGYQHAGIRKFLADVGTVASLAMPVSAAETAVGKAAVLTMERILPAAILLIDENRLNLVKWFPKWGPKMLRYADLVKTGLAIYGIARFAVSGYQIFKNWKAVRDSRAALEGASQSENAEKVAVALEQQADEIFAEVEKIHANEPSPTTAGTKAADDAKDVGAAAKAADETKAAGGLSKAADEAKNAPAASKADAAVKGGGGLNKAADEAKAADSLARSGEEAKGAVPGTKAAADEAKAVETADKAKLFEGITDETKKMLDNKPELKKLLEANPKAAMALKVCQSTCFPDFATEAQISRLEKFMEDAEQYGVKLSEDSLKKFLHKQKNPADLDRAIGVLEGELSDRVKELGLGTKAEQVAKEFQEAGKKVPDPTVPEVPPTTPQLRGAPGEATGGEKLKAITGKWFPDGRVGQFPKQIADRMRGMHFKNFDEFRETFWQMVAQDPVLGKGWTPDNMRRMAQGQPPFTATSQRVGGGSNAVYQLNHKQAIKNAGAVYDMDNIEVVTPLFHQAIGD